MSELSEVPMAPGLAGPLGRTPPRAPGSVRRTMTFDTSHPYGMDGPLVVVGRARDLLTTDQSTARVLARAELGEELAGPSLAVRRWQCEPAWRDPDELAGTAVASGFRKLVRASDAASPEEALLLALLDDLPGAALVGGYAAARSGTSSGRRSRDQFEKRLGVCAGWVRGASMDVLFAERGEIPLPFGEPFLPADDGVAELGWHDLLPLPPTSMRRQRRMDVVWPRSDGQPVRLDVHFRDIYVASPQATMVVHEYSVLAEVDDRSGHVLGLDALARVLPWPECPGALSSAQQAVGRPLAELRERMSGQLVGSTSCTHLTDTLRAMGHLDPLVRHVGHGSDRRETS